LALTTDLPGLEGGQQQRAHRLDPADHLDDEVDVGRVTSPCASVVSRCAGRRGAGRTADGDPGDLDRPADARGEVARLLLERRSTALPTVPHRAARPISGCVTRSTPAGAPARAVDGATAGAGTSARTASRANTSDSV
jgi:hypothetical protein